MQQATRSNDQLWRRGSPAPALHVAGLLMLSLAQHAQELVDVHALPDAQQLPALLPEFEGGPTARLERWRDQRRPELMRTFQEEVYGVPPAPARVELGSVRSLGPVLGGLGELEEQELVLLAPGGAVATRVRLLLCLPSSASGPAPIFLGLNKCGNHTLLPEAAPLAYERPWIHSGCSDGEWSAAGSREESWCPALLLQRGWGLASFQVGDIDPDRDEEGDGVQAHFELPGVHPRQRWGTLAAWAWGLSRAVDRLVLDARIDPDRICLYGHSRRGKAALLCAALDERIALVVPHQSGTGGCALSRENEQESVARITRVFPHWFAQRFSDYAERAQRLPVDQHLLVALVAPRPVLETVGLQDTWANFDSSWRALVAASPAWELFGVAGLVGDEPLVWPAKIEAESVGRLAQYRRDTEHVMDAEYWGAILDFARLHLWP